MMGLREAFRPLRDICADIDAEIDDHLVRGAAGLIREGVAPVEAHRAARERMGDLMHCLGEFQVGAASYPDRYHHDA